MFDQIKGNKLFEEISGNKLFDQISENDLSKDEKLAHNINVYAPNVHITMDEKSDDDISNYYD